MGMRTYLVERRFKLGADHPTHPGYITPIRHAVPATSKAEALADANEATEAALEALNGVGKGEWLGDAVVLYEMAVDEARGK